MDYSKDLPSMSLLDYYMDITLRATESRSLPLFASAKGGKSGGSGELARGHTIGFLFLSGRCKKAGEVGIWKLKEHKEEVAMSSVVVQ